MDQISSLKRMAKEIREAPALDTTTMAPATILMLRNCSLPTQALVVKILEESYANHVADIFDKVIDILEEVLEVLNIELPPVGKEDT